jgi:hypothetical protein
VNNTLYIATEAESHISAEVAQELAGQTVQFLDLSDTGIETALPDGWERLQADDFFDADMFRREFLDFLEDTPQRPIYKKKSFDELFRLPSGYSLWWTTVGAERTPNKTPFREMRILWIADKALDSLRPAAIVAACRDGKLGSALVARAAAGRIPVRLRGAAAQARRPIGLRWLWSQFVQSLKRPFKLSYQAAAVRALTRLRAESREKRSQPAILLRPKISRNLRVERGAPCLPFWSDFCREFSRQAPQVRQRFLLNRDLKGEQTPLIPWLRESGARLLRSLDGAVPLIAAYPALGAWFRALPSQAAALIRLYRLERSPAYAQSFVFAGANVSSIFIPRLRQAVAGIAEWERKVAANVKCLRRVGNIKAMLVLAEFYRGPMVGIAAAQRLGIPTVGVQHGTIFPMHLTYTVPRGHVTGAPVPDYFAAYGDYAKEVVSMFGAYPADRVWITGTPRLDYLVKEPPDSSRARRSLGLPADKQIVLVATQTYRWYPQAVEAVFEAIKSRTDCVVCVKTHFGDRRRMPVYREMAERLGISSVRFFEDRFDDLLAACDVLISASSTTVLEACLLDRPTICVNFSHEPDRYPYAQEGASLPAGSRQQMQAALEVVLARDSRHDLAERRRAFVQRHAGPTAEGRGATVLAAQLRAIVSDHRAASPRSELPAPVCSAHVD